MVKYVEWHTLLQRSGCAQWWRETATSSSTGGTIQTGMCQTLSTPSSVYPYCHAFSSWSTVFPVQICPGRYTCPNALNPTQSQQSPNIHNIHIDVQ